MSSLFFQISKETFLQASPIYDNPFKNFSLRIISRVDCKEHFTYLPNVNFTELKMLLNGLHLSLIREFHNMDDVRRYWKYREHLHKRKNFYI
jgi:hypothetical protein